MTWPSFKALCFRFSEFYNAYSNAKNIIRLYEIPLRVYFMILAPIIYVVTEYTSLKEFDLVDLIQIPFLMLTSKK